MSKKKYAIRRNLVPREQVLAILAQNLAALRDWCRESWEWVQELLSEDPERRAAFDGSTVAAMVYDRMKTQAIQRLAGQPGIQVETCGRMVSIHFNRQISLRFKKFDPKLRSKNVLTNRQELMYCHQLELEGIAEKLTQLTLGYVTDITNLKLTGIYLTCPNGWSRNLWTMPLWQESADPALEFQITPEQEIEEAQVVVVPKPLRKTADNGEDV